ncbi:MAG: FkbM family methyltransferase [Verrucomicrobiae bacterium]|nr:FkbM family methyltransferase [Verrucomicrobiae bacterium]
MRMKQAIFGAGINGGILYTAALRGGVPIDFFIDDFSSRNTYYDIPVFRVEEINPHETEVYISIFQGKNGRLCSDELKAELKSRGFISVSTFEKTFYKWPGIGQAFAENSYLWMRSDHKLMLDDNKIAVFANMLSDQKSRDLLQTIVSFRKTLDAVHYPMPESSIQYFPDDIPLFSEFDKLCFIDGGAFTGDSVVAAIEACDRLEKAVSAIVSFEPNQNNQVQLRHEMSIQKQNKQDTIFAIYPCALWSETKTLSLKSDAQSSAIKSVFPKDCDCSSVCGTSIDDTLFSMAPNYIKLDVEGAEAEALKGAIRTIKTFRPVLAVCLYHKPEDLWEIPIQIYNICSDYNMYLRLYGHMGIELVLYCVPVFKLEGILS